MIDGDTTDSFRRASVPEPTLTPALWRRICANIRRAVPVKFAVEAEGVTMRIFRAWLKRGKDGETPFDELLLAVRRARGQSVVRLVRLAQAGGEAGAGARFLLERRHPDAFGATQSQERAGGADLLLLKLEDIDTIGNEAARVAVESVLARIHPN